jgi:hypothetical protein
MSHRPLFHSGLLIVLLLVGCGPRTLPGKQQTYPVKGKITYNGKPVVNAVITLVPVEKVKTFEASSTSDANGNFSLRTFSNFEPDGALPGEYEVKITGGTVGAAAKGKKGTPLPEKVQKEPRRTTVTAGENTLNLDLS